MKPLPRMIPSDRLSFPLAYSAQGYATGTRMVLSYPTGPGRVSGGILAFPERFLRIVPDRTVFCGFMVRFENEKI